MEIEEELRNRVVGAVIVTILAMIFLPMLLNDPKQDDGQQIIDELKIPSKAGNSPSLVTSILPTNADDVIKETATAEIKPNAQQPTALVTTKAAQQAQAALNNSIEVITTQNPPVAPVVKIQTIKPIQVKPTVPVATIKPQDLKPPRLNEPAKKVSQRGRWFIQVASFSKQKNAFSLRDKLRRQGFAATVSSTWSKKGRIHKLRVGPELDKQRAISIKNKLDQLNNVQSIIVSN